MDKSIKQSSPPRAMLRKRGRPSGSNRVPLSLSERRARNAEYEKERRMGISAALAELATAARLGDDIPTRDLLAEVVHFLQTTEQSDRSWETDVIRRCNDNLASQITMLERRIATQPDLRVPIKKRMVEASELDFPPSKRFSPNQKFQHPSAFPCYSSQSYCSSNDQLSPDQDSKPWSTSDSQFHPMPLRWTPQPQSSWHCPSSISPLTSYDHLSPVYLEAAPASVSQSPAACFYSTQTTVKEEGLAEMASVWTEALYAADGPRLTLGQMNRWATEDDLVSLYL